MVSKPIQGLSVMESHPIGPLSAKIPRLENVPRLASAMQNIFFFLKVQPSCEVSSFPTIPTVEDDVTVAI